MPAIAKRVVTSAPTCACRSCWNWEGNARPAPRDRLPQPRCALRALRGSTPKGSSGQPTRAATAATSCLRRRSHSSRFCTSGLTCFAAEKCLSGIRARSRRLNVTVAIAGKGGARGRPFQAKPPLITLAHATSATRKLWGECPSLHFAARPPRWSSVGLRAREKRVSP
jgi:hypothetical protein